MTWQALGQWNSVSDSSARIRFKGNVTFKGDWTDRLGSDDGINGAELVHRDWFFGPYLVALTSLHYNTSTGKLREADIFFNGMDWNFGNIQTGDFRADFGTIFTHELGHFLGLGHSQAGKSTMFNSLRMPYATKRRTLAKDDRRGLRWLYPKKNSAIPGPSLWKLSEGGCGWAWTYNFSPTVIDQSAATENFCIYGAAFQDGLIQVQLISESTGDIKNPSSNIQFLSENLVQLDLDLSQLGPDSYDLVVDDAGKSGKKDQALIVNLVASGARSSMDRGSGLRGPGKDAGNSSDLGAGAEPGNAGGGCQVAGVGDGNPGWLLSFAPVIFLPAFRFRRFFRDRL